MIADTHPPMPARTHAANGGTTYADLLAYYNSHDEDDHREMCDEEKDF
jgi:hypothetical protein